MLNFPKLVEIDFNAPHVCFLGANGKIAFAQKKSNFHVGCEVICTLPNFKQASDFCKNYRKEKKAEVL